MSQPGKNPFDIPIGVQALSWSIETFRPLFIGLGNLESHLLRKRLRAISIDRPVYISGLARAGSTITLEFFNTIAHTATHRYLDFPMLYTPYLWDRMVNSISFPAGDMHERPHRDGIVINLESPEAMEEVLWSGFFPNLHNPRVSNVLDENATHARFVAFYTDHIKKMLLLRKATRYVSKANYNLARIPFIVKHLPDARFVLLVRDPVKHVCAFLKQQDYIVSVQRKHPRVLGHFRRSGHFEYGIDLRPLNLSGTPDNNGIMKLFAAGESVRAWARYWAQVNKFIFEMTRRYPRNCTFFRHEDLCDNGHDTLKEICRFTECDCPDHKLADFATRLHRPTYYSVPLTDNQQETIHEETAATAAHFGYDR